MRVEIQLGSFQGKLIWSNPEIENMRENRISIGGDEGTESIDIYLEDSEKERLIRIMKGE